MTLRAIAHTNPRIWGYLHANLNNATASEAGEGRDFQLPNRFLGLVIAQDHRTANFGLFIFSLDCFVQCRMVGGHGGV